MIRDVTKYMDKYEFNNVGSILYSFIWNDFCDTYIEFAKFSLDSNVTKSTLYYVINSILKMLHPLMPYVTDEIYDKLPFKDSENIMISCYPTYSKKYIFDCEIEFDRIIDFIKVFRNIKQENNIGKDFKVKLENVDDLIIKMLKLTDHIVESDLDITKYHITNTYYSLDLYYEKVLTEEDRLLKEKQIETLKSNISRREKLLSNPGYVNKAPKALVEGEKIKLEEEKLLLEKLLNE